MAKQRLALGIDLGGTSIKIGVVTHEGRVVGRGQLDTDAQAGVSGVLANMLKAAEQALGDAGLSMADMDGVGLGAPGTCDVERGMVIHGVNLGWRNVPVGELLRDALGRPAFVDNDANCAALGEQWCGVARGSDHVVMLTLGTGVGGGLILDGEIYHGIRGWAGEIGHMPVVENGAPCNCGQRGCLETVASATGMAAAAMRSVGAGKAPRLAELLRQQGSLDARAIITAAQSGDQPALEVLQTAGRFLGFAVAGLVSALNPQLVVVGGGASRAGDLILEPMRETVRQRAMPGPAAAARIVAAELGNDAGLIGASTLVWRHRKKFVKKWEDTE